MEKSRLIRRMFLMLLCVQVLLMCATAALGQHEKAASAKSLSSSGGEWWKRAVVYEIFPRSFQDSTGDGIGDILGIVSKLDYLRDLGVDAIWLTPCYPSPLVDFGYDVADYEAIDPELGTMADFELLIKEAKKRNISVLLDLVLNHTSYKHPWFLESRSSRTNPRRNWYTWRDGREGGGPPNNWQSQFRGSAWSLDEQTGQYYLHQFWPEQPDLNWRNPEVQHAIADVMRFWLRKGVAGFRMDAVPSLFEDPEYSDKSHFDPMPESHQVLLQLRRVAEEFGNDRILIGETYAEDAAHLAAWSGRGNEIHLPLNFQFDLVNKMSAPAFRRELADMETVKSFLWPANFLSSHDQPREIDRYGDGYHNDAIARCLAVLLLTSRGTPVIYYGEELGMTTSTPTRIEDVRDTDGIRNWPEKKGRDGERTPMQWDDSPNAGFSSAKPWLPVPENVRTLNVKTERANRNSLLNLYRELIAIRRNNTALQVGEYIPLDTADSDSVLCYLRGDPKSGKAVLVALNMSTSSRVVYVSFEQLGGIRNNQLLALLQTDSSVSESRADGGYRLTLPPYAGFVGSIVHTAVTELRVDAIKGTLKIGAS